MDHVMSERDLSERPKQQIMRQGEIKDLYAEVQGMLATRNQTEKRQSSSNLLSRNQNYYTQANTAKLPKVIRTQTGRFHNLTSDKDSFVEQSFYSDPTIVQEQQSHYTPHQTDEVYLLKRKNELLSKKLDQLTLAMDVQLQKQQSNIHEIHEPLRQKDHQINNLLAQLDQVQTELTAYRNKGYLPNGFDKLQTLQSLLRESEAKNAQLQQEIKHMQKIQVEQARALEKISDENDYPMRINSLIEEICSPYIKNYIQQLRIFLIMT